ncbi:MAG: aminoglycoside phosphotransferase family protein [Gaiellaceae bacterium]
MSAVRMHEDELLFDETLVRRLLEEQFPEWAELPLERVPSDGTDNALFRLGDELVVRLPRIDWAVAARKLEHEWLPRLAPQLPVEIPAPVALGEPAAGYPWPWSVYRWIDGERPVAGEFDDAVALARFAKALRRIGTAGAPVARRGAPFSLEHEQARAALAQLDGAVDADAALAVLESAVRSPAWSGPPVWLHGDLMPGNLLVRGGRLAAVIDWGCLGVGDPACDCMPAWNLFDAERRAVYRVELDVDDATWERGRGWALKTGLAALPYYLDTNPGLAANARYRIEQVLTEVS